VSSPPADAAAPQIAPRDYLRLIGLGAAIGLPAALMAAFFLAAVHEVEHWVWVDLPEHLGETAPPWYLVIGLPVVGAAVVLAARLLLPGDGGHHPLHGMSTGGATPLSHAPGIIVAAIGTLAFGAILGPEGPLIALGSLVGVAFSTLARRRAKEEAVLGAAGSFSAISALFGGPLVGGVMMTESSVGLGAVAIPVLLPGFVAAAIGYLLFVGFGDWGGLEAQSLAVPSLPPYTGVHATDLLVAIAVGLLTAVAVTLARRGARRVEALGPSLGGTAGHLLLGGLAVGLIAQTADWLGADSQVVLFSGQSGVPALVAEDSTAIILILLLAKAIGYAICLGCGFRGGPIFPAIFLGIAFGTFAVVWFDVSPTLAVAVGTAAGTAAGTRLLLTSIVFSTLLVGSAGLDATPAAVLAAVAAWVMMAAIERRTQPLP